MSVDNVVASMMALMAADIDNERFISVDENLTYGALLGQLARTLGKRPPTHQLKYWQLRLVQFFDWCLSPVLGKERRVTADTIYGLKNRSDYDNTKLTNSLDIAFVPLDETLQFSCHCYMKELG